MQPAITCILLGFYCWTAAANDPTIVPTMSAASTSWSVESMDLLGYVKNGYLNGPHGSIAVDTNRSLVFITSLYGSYSVAAVSYKDSSNPQVIGNLTFIDKDASWPDYPGLYGATYDELHKIVIVGGYTRNILAVVSAKDPKNLELLGTVYSEEYLADLRATCVDASGSVAYAVASESNSLAIVSYYNASTPLLLGGLENDPAMKGANGIACDSANARVFVTAGSSNSLLVINVSNSTNPFLIGVVSDSTALKGALGIAYNGLNDVVFVTAFGTSNRGMLTAVSVVNSSKPVIVGNMSDSSMGGPHSVAIHEEEGIAFVSSYSKHSVVAVDISDPRAPSMLCDNNNSEVMKKASGVGFDFGAKLVFVAGQDSNSLAVLTTLTPTGMPTAVPTSEPTLLPSLLPTGMPTAVPTNLCPAGTFLKNGSQCENCTAGKYSDAGSRVKRECLVCPEGKYSNTGKGSCELCPGGKYIEDNGVNYRLHSKSDSCLDCTEGKFSDKLRRICIPCSGGHFVSESECYLCPKGKFAPVALNEQCEDSPEGFYTNNNTGATAIISCNAGYHAASGSTYCKVCPAGRFSGPGSGECQNCSAGKVAPATASSSCSSCSAGFFQDLRGQSACRKCSAGRVTQSTGMARCFACPVGEVAPNTTSTSCDTCSSPTTTDGTGKRYCNSCERKYFWNPSECNDGHCCTLCPNGVTCSSSGMTLQSLDVKKGWYRFSNSSTEVYECELVSSYKGLCGGGTEPGDISCKGNALGPLCSLCDREHYHAGTGKKCRPCRKISLMMQTLVPVIIVTFALMLCLIVWHFEYFTKARERMQRWSKSRRVNLEWAAVGLRILFFDYQVITKFTEMQGIIWPSPFDGYVNLLNLIFLDVRIWLPSIECTKFNHYTSLMIWTLGPILLYILFLARACGKALIKERKGENDDSRGENRGERRDLGSEAGGRKELSMEESNNKGLPFVKLRPALQEAFIRTTQVALGFVSLIHTLICIRLFQMFDCVEFDVGMADSDTVNCKVHGRKCRMLSSDLSIDCADDKHEAYVIYAYLMVVVYVLFVPLAMALEKRRYLHANSSQGLLSAPYKIEYWWFDAADLYYRLSMTGFLLMVTKDKNLRAVCCVYIAICFLAYVTYAAPLLNKSLNKILTTGQFVVCVTVTSGFIVSTIPEDKGGRQVIGWSLLFVNVFIIAYAFQQHRSEALFRIINALQRQEVFDTQEFIDLYTGASKISLARAILESAEQCLANIEHEDENGGDRCWAYLTSVIFALRGRDGVLVCTKNVPSQVDWVSYAEAVVEVQVKEKAHRALVQNLKVVKEGWCQKKGEINQSWKRRYLLLAEVQRTGRSPTLMYFGSQEAAERAQCFGNFDELALGTIEMHNIRRILRFENRQILELDDRRGRLWKFAFESIEDYIEWFKELEAIIHDLESGGARITITDEPIAMLSSEDFKKATRAVFGLIVDDELTSKVFMHRASERITAFEECNPMRDNVTITAAPRALTVDNGAKTNHVGTRGEVQSADPRENRENYDTQHLEGKPGGNCNIAKVQHGEIGDEGIECTVFDGNDRQRRSSVFGLLEVRPETAYSIENADRILQEPHRPMINIQQSTSAPQLSRATTFGETESAVIGSDDALELIKTLATKLRSGDVVPTIFAVVQLLGTECHRRILVEQQKAAENIISEPHWGSVLKALDHQEADKQLEQKVAVRMSTVIKGTCTANGFDEVLDDEVLPALICAISKKARPYFQQSLLKAMPGAVLHDEGREQLDSGVGSSIELKVGPTKAASRVSVKVADYREEKGDGNFPYSKFVFDTLRASYICDTAEDMVKAYRALLKSEVFDVVRMKNKIGRDKGPFNLHVNVMFKLEKCEDPILCEVQIYPRRVFELQHRQHLAYELRRAGKVEELVKK